MSAEADVRLPFPHEVYRIWDKAGNLLYVGMGRVAHNRVVTHCEPFLSRVQASWLMSGLMDRWHAEMHPARAAARDAEREAIRNEHPMFNKHFNKGWQLMRDQYFMAFYDEDIEQLGRTYNCYSADMPEELDERLPVIERDRAAEQVRIDAYAASHNLIPAPKVPQRMTADELRDALNRVMGGAA